MILVATVSIITFYVQRKLKSDPQFWDEHRARAIAVAAVSLMMWLTIATAGRWIAYLDHG
jgi:hypothetical protein